MSRKVVRREEPQGVDSERSRDSFINYIRILTIPKKGYAIRRLEIEWTEPGKEKSKEKSK